MKVGLSFDIEDFDNCAANTLAQKRIAISSQLDTQCDDILKILQQRKIKATFFILGSIARERTSLVKTIHYAGHEIGIHGFEHRALQTLSPGNLRKDLQRTLEVVEGTTDARVRGFRSPFFSLPRSTGWLLDILKELGFLYDSSLLPSAWKLSELAKAKDIFRFPNGIYEVPVTVGTWLGVSMIPSGGGFFRLLPYTLIASSLAKELRHSGRAVTYFHNYDFYETPWNFNTNLSALTFRLPSWLRLRLCARSCGSKVKSKLLKLLEQFEFGTLLSLLPSEQTELRPPESKSFSSSG